LRPEVQTYVYSELLARHISQKTRQEISQRKLRERSAHLISARDVQAVDTFLINEVNRLRRSSHIIIDSHPVTKESYGFRVTAFSVPLLSALQPTVICMLYTDSGVIRKRIAVHSKGRPLVTRYEADFHAMLQASVATNYGIQSGVPIFFFDSSKSVDTALNKLVTFL
jgi:adenylate kinase